MIPINVHVVAVDGGLVASVQYFDVAAVFEEAAGCRVGDTPSGCSNYCVNGAAHRRRRVAENGPQLQHIRLPAVYHPPHLTRLRRSRVPRATAALMTPPDYPSKSVITTNMEPSVAVALFSGLATF
jgi:hypothetical protein